jgi:hypothetical protein
VIDDYPTGKSPREGQTVSPIRDDSNGRLDGGRFAPGHKFAKGNPNARRMYELRKALLDATDPETVARVGRKLAEQALEGDVQAAKVYLEFTIGKPPRAVELSGPDGGPLGDDWGRLQAVLFGALARHPEARIDVASALKRLDHDVRHEDSRTGDEPGPEPADGGGRPGP